MKFNKTAVAYVLGVGTSMVAIAAGAAIGSARQAAFDTITVHRINVVEPDGTLRMVISDKAEFPGIIVKGKEYPHASRQDVAGAIFFNDEGTENGGLIFGGQKSGGKVVNFGHLSFDQYEQDQVLTLEQSEQNGRRAAGISIDDRPTTPLDFAALSRLEAMPPGPARTAEAKRLAAEGATGEQRVFLGKTAKRNSEVDLKDADGHTRLRLLVSAEGAASIQFLDADGKVARTILPGDGK